MSQLQVQLPIDKEPALRVVTHPNDANPKGDIFGGWLMSQIDIAGSIIAVARAKGPVATVAVKGLQFIKPIYVHDVVSFYPAIIAIGKTSITTTIEVFSQRAYKDEFGGFDFQTLKVAEAEVVYVAVSEPGKKREVPVA